MKKIVILLSLFFCAVFAAEEINHDELKEICNSMNELSKALEVKNEANECLSLLKDVESNNNNSKASSIKIRFLGAFDATSTESKHLSVALDQSQGHLPPEQYENLVKITVWSRGIVDKLRAAAAEFDKALEAKNTVGNRFKAVDDLVTKAADLQVKIEKEFSPKTQHGELKAAFAYGHEVTAAITRIKKEMLDF